jgi:hypothetical protein
LSKSAAHDGAIGAAIHGVPGMNDLRERFETQMLLVFYVAESQRFDRIAAVRDQIIRARSGVVRATPQSDFRDWAMSALFKNFGSASATVRRAVSAQWRGPSATVARPTDPGAREPTPQRPSHCCSATPGSVTRFWRCAGSSR